MPTIRKVDHELSVDQDCLQSRSFNKGLCISHYPLCPMPYFLCLISLNQAKNTY